MTLGYEETGLWRDIEDLPDALARTLDQRAGWSDAASYLQRGDVRRLVVSGNGASYYAGLALWAASLIAPSRGPDVTCIPSGLIADGRFAWRDGDVLVAISSSGEFRDLVEATARRTTPQPFVLITGDRESTLAHGAGPIASFDLPRNRAVTHTQDFCCATATALALWAAVSDDSTLASAVAAVPETTESSVALTRAWAGEVFQSLEVPRAAVAFGHGPGWAAAMEAALLIKEVPQILCEGLETREAATSAMTCMGTEFLVLSLPSTDDPFIDEAESLCARTGATVVRAAADTTADSRLLAVCAFPAAAALASELAIRRERDVDNPGWVDTYYATARVAATPGPA